MHHNEYIIVVNNNPDYLVTGFYMNEGQIDRAGQLKWLSNMFRTSFQLQYHRAWWLHRSTSGCVVMIKIEMQLRKGRKLAESNVKQLDLCKDAIPCTIVYVNPAPEPQVTSVPAGAVAGDAH